MMWPVMVKNNHIRTVLLSGQTPPPHLWRYHRSRFTHPLILTKWKTYVEVKRSYEWWQGQEEDTTPSFRRRRHVCPWRERFYHQTDCDGRCTPFPGLFQFRNIYLFGDVTTLHMNKAGLFFGSTDNVINVRICRAFHSSAQANISSHDINCNRIQGTLPMNGNGIELGQYAECRRTFSQEDVSKFGNLIGDLNQIHFPSDATGNPSVTKDISSVDRPIVHGMFLSSLFSSIFGTLVPGSIYRSQTLQFQSAVYVDEEVIGRVTSHQNQSKRISEYKAVKSE
ncbi:hypothetical protein ACHAXS_012225 [Conticribra weissflogii]